MQYRPCQLSDILNVERHNQTLRYTVDEDGLKDNKFDEDWDSNHGYEENSTEYECSNRHQDYMTEDLFDSWDEVLLHLKEYGEGAVDASHSVPQPV